MQCACICTDNQPTTFPVRWTSKGPFLNCHLIHLGLWYQHDKSNPITKGSDAPVKPPAGREREMVLGKTECLVFPRIQCRRIWAMEFLGCWKGGGTKSKLVYNGNLWVLFNIYLCYYCIRFLQNHCLSLWFQFDMTKWELISWVHYFWLCSWLKDHSVNLCTVQITELSTVCR